MSRAVKTPPYTQSQLESMKKEELLIIAEKLGVEGISKSNLKADIISAILEAVQ